MTDAIRRAQAWLAAASPRPWNPDEMIYTLEEEPQAEVNANLAALGPASVALAVALEELNEAVKSNGLFLDMRTADDALAEWAEACGDGAEPH